MNSSVLIEIEHTKHMKLIDLENQVSNSAMITTVKEDQKRAIIKLIGKKEGEPTFILNEYEINIPYKYQRGDIQPKITVKANLEGKKLHVKGILDDQSLFSDTLNVKKLLPGVNWLPIAAAVGGAVVVILLIFGLYYLLSPGSGAGYLSSNSANTQKQDTIQNTTQNTKQSTTQSQNTSNANSEDTIKNTDSVEYSADDNSNTALVTEDETENQTGALSTDTDSTFDTATPDETEEPEQMPAIPEGTIAKTVYFEPNISALTVEAKSKLREMLDELETYKDAKIRIWGHCAIKGTEEGREQLSMERAQNVKNYLTTLGFTSNLIDLKWFAGTKPVTQDEDKQYLNRRVEIAILSE